MRKTLVFEPFYCGKSGKPAFRSCFDVEISSRNPSTYQSRKLSLFFFIQNISYFLKILRFTWSFADCLNLWGWFLVS